LVGHISKADFPHVMLRSAIADRVNNDTRENMDQLNQSVTDTTLPTSIDQAFEQWINLERQILAALDVGADAGVATGRRVAVEHLAVTLPTVSAADVWRLIRMTTDEPTQPRTSQDMLFVRSYIEVAGA
jgi:predicted transcriptional regulator